MMNKLNKILLAINLFILSAFSIFALSTPVLNNINVNDGDILTKDIINWLQDNILKIYNWIKWWFTTFWPIKINSNWTQLILNTTWNNKTGLVDLQDKWNSKWILWKDGNNRFIIQNKKDWTNNLTIDENNIILIEGSDIWLKAKWTNKWIRILSDWSLCMWTCW